MRMQRISRTNAERSALTKERLVAIARRQFAERGYDGTSLEYILPDAGLTKGALYHHFGDKKGRFREVVIAVQSEVAANAREAGSRKSDPVEALLAVCPRKLRGGCD
jgi:AcrR family transcriptional regulator